MYDRSRLCVVVSYRISAETVIMNITCEHFQLQLGVFLQTVRDRLARADFARSFRRKDNIPYNLPDFERAVCWIAIDTEAVPNKIHPSRGGEGGGQLE
jgi:hypothetical protein